MYTIDPTTDAHEIERVPAADGELVLRQVGEHYEIISNGCFLMDTRAGASERLLVRTALDALEGVDARGALATPEAPDAPETLGVAGGLRILVGGLGVGFTLREALTDPRVGQVTVVEREPAVVRWGRGPLAPFSGHALADSRVRVITSDLVAWVRSPSIAPADGVSERADREAAARSGKGSDERPHVSREGSDERFHALCLDIDNGPDWTVTDGNASLYDDAGLAALRARLLPGGVLTVWSATASPAFADRLRARFAQVTVHQVPVPRGEPDVVFVARG
ncbi:spermidine synthase [Embleya sp. NPDC127516]|uniref:spermidine synthase n=1 Tax=Embleya sp. NPDC127516 TaxID=3363990 RepID=UPI00380F834D